MPAPAKPKLPTSDKKKVDHVAVAAETLSKMAQVGTRADRMENEVRRIVDDWAGILEPDEVSEKLEELRENMAASVARFEQEMQDNGVKTLNKAEQRLLESLQACTRALESARLPELA